MSSMNGGAGERRAWFFWNDLRTPLRGLAALIALTLLSALALGIFWGVGYRIAKAIGGWE